MKKPLERKRNGKTIRFSTEKPRHVNAIPYKRVKCRYDEED